jgi:hypothetical protein
VSFPKILKIIKIDFLNLRTNRDNMSDEMSDELSVITHNAQVIRDAVAMERMVIEREIAADVQERDKCKFCLCDDISEIERHQNIIEMLKLDLKHQKRRITVTTDRIDYSIDELLQYKKRERSITIEHGLDPYDPTEYLDPSTLKRSNRTP